MTAYANIGGIALLFFILTAFVSSEVTDEKDSISMRSVLMILLSVATFGLAGEYATAQMADAWTSFLVALGAAAGIGGPSAFLRLLTKKCVPGQQADNKAV